MAQFVGYLVSIECKNTFYQGIVCGIDLNSNNIQLKHCYKDGMRCGSKLVEINSNTIDNIEILADSSNAKAFLNQLKLKNEAAKIPHTSPSKSISQRSEYSITNGNGRKSPRTRTTTANESCFSSSNGFNVNDDFDFEKNLALFDKQAFYEEMGTSLTKQVETTVISGLSSKLPPNYQPLSLETLFSSTKQQASKSPQEQLKVQQKNYRCDEMILDPGVPIQLSQIKLPISISKTYTTDNGLKIPCITQDLKNKLFEESYKHGFTKERHIESMGHSCAEMALTLLGGQNRFHPKNNHQKPKILVLANNEIHGAYAICVARFLSVRSCNVFLYLQSDNLNTLAVELNKPLIDGELKLCKLSDTKIIQNVDEIKTEAIDLIINGLDSGINNNLINSQLWFRNLVKYLSICKANILSIDPSPEGSLIQSKYSIVPILPQQMNKNCGRIYLCDLGLSPKIFNNLNIKYQSPFGAKFIIPLYDD